MMEHVPGTCLNCGSEEVTVESPMYCDEGCGQAAKLVRYVRSKRAEGRDAEPDIKQAIQMKMAHVLGGGYHSKARQVSAAIRAEVFRRAGNKCENCGRELIFEPVSPDRDAVATIQHTNGDSNDLVDLKAFCNGCNTADARQHFKMVEPGSSADQTARDLQARFIALEPERVCDDAENWKTTWRGLKGANLQAIRSIK